ncbi:unnamed protein product [Amoebophrya sp. A25]|nr:unnamed protein product [Amoebophrya sp. A25]|eukprot:GSA25T00017417001.1
MVGTPETIGGHFLATCLGQVVRTFLRRILRELKARIICPSRPTATTGPEGHQAAPTPSSPHRVLEATPTPSSTSLFLGGSRRRHSAPPTPRVLDLDLLDQRQLPVSFIRGCDAGASNATANLPVDEQVDEKAHRHSDPKGDTNDPQSFYCSSSTSCSCSSASSSASVATSSAASASSQSSSRWRWHIGSGSFLSTASSSSTSQTDTLPLSLSSAHQLNSPSSRAEEDSEQIVNSEEDESEVALAIPEVCSELTGSLLNLSEPASTIVQEVVQKAVERVLVSGRDELLSQEDHLLLLQKAQQILTSPVAVVEKNFERLSHFQLLVRNACRVDRVKERFLRRLRRHVYEDLTNATSQRSSTSSSSRLPSHPSSSTTAANPLLTSSPPGPSSSNSPLSEDAQGNIPNETKHFPDG